MQLSDAGNPNVLRTHSNHDGESAEKTPERLFQNRSLLKERAFDEIKKKIMDEEFPPGSFLAERKLAIMLGMSKTPVKSALERLEMEGFVTISPQQCILVREIPVDEIADQYEIRTALETHIVRGLAKRISQPQVTELRNSLALQRESAESSNVSDWVDRDASFHLLLAEQYGNQAIYRTMLDLKNRMHRIIARVFRVQPLRSRQSLDEHQAIADAIISGKSDDAARLVTIHLQQGRDLVLAPRK
ncbi:MAG: GntR family transcriptional regulator [Pirellula sp.]